MFQKRGADSRGVWRRQSATKGLHGWRKLVAVQGFEPRLECGDERRREAESTVRRVPARLRLIA
jgi:hypothetical protein